MTPTYEVAKVNRRLVIREAETGHRVYVMPDFLRPVRDRGVLTALARRLENDDGIQQRSPKERK